MWMGKKLHEMDGYDFAISIAEGDEKFYRMLDGRVDSPATHPPRDSNE